MYCLLPYSIDDELMRSDDLSLNQTLLIRIQNIDLWLFLSMLPWASFTGGDEVNQHGVHGMNK